jgi:hypothetical protein
MFSIGSMRVDLDDPDQEMAAAQHSSLCAANKQAGARARRYTG